MYANSRCQRLSQLRPDAAAATCSIDRQNALRIGFRERESEGGAAPELAVDKHRSAMFLDGRLDEREAEASASFNLRIGAQLDKFGEEPPLIVGIDAVAMIRDG